MKVTVSTLALGVLLGCTVGCSENTRIAVLVVTPDGGDPFYPPDAANQVRVTLEDDASAPITANVTATGAFDLTFTLPHPGETSRLRTDALSNGTVVGSGATPPVQWSQLGADLLPVFVQRTDSLVVSLWSLSVGRISPVLFTVPGGQHFAAALAGAPAAEPIDVFDILALADVCQPGTDAGVGSCGAMLNAPYTQGVSILPLASGAVLIVSGCQAVVWTPSTNAISMSTGTVTPDRCAVFGSTAVALPSGGGVLLGGYTSGDAGPTTPVPTVDVVDGLGNFTVGPSLAVARNGPGAILLPNNNQILVASGQAAGSALFELWSQSSAVGSHTIQTGNASVDNRTGVALVDVGGGIALALGGMVPGGADAGAPTLAPNDVIFNYGCLSTGCNGSVSTQTLLTTRRTSAVAALAEGARVVVAGGTLADGMTPAGAVELVNVSVPTNPIGLPSIGTLPYVGLSMLPLETGALMIAGGNQTTVWLYRH